MGGGDIQWGSDYKYKGAILMYASVDMAHLFLIDVNVDKWNIDARLVSNFCSRKWDRLRWASAGCKICSKSVPKFVVKFVQICNYILKISKPT